MQDGRDSRISTDGNGDKWLTDENGKLLKDENGAKIPPTHSEKISGDGEFTVYDTSRGHCPFCGNISCTSNCFK